MKKLSILLLSLPAIWFLARREETDIYAALDRWRKTRKLRHERAYLRCLERWYQEMVPVLEAHSDAADKDPKWLYDVGTPSTLSGYSAQRYFAHEGSGIYAIPPNDEVGL
jgi:hypothetical protein